MDFFSRNKVLSVIIVILVVLNIFSVGLLLLERIPPPLSPLTSERQPMGRNMDRGRVFIENELQLSPEQRDKFSILRADHFPAVQDINSQINDLNHELMSESFSQSPDTAFINSITEEIELLWGQMAKLNFYHFRELYSILDSTQSEKFKTVMGEMLPMQGQPRERMGRRKGMRMGRRRGN